MTDDDDDDFDATSVGLVDQKEEELDSLRLFVYARARRKSRRVRRPDVLAWPRLTRFSSLSLFDRPREVPDDDDDAIVGLVIFDGLQLKSRETDLEARKGAGSPAQLFGSRRFASVRLASALDARARIESRWGTTSRCVVRIWCSKFNRLVELTRRRRTARS